MKKSALYLGIDPTHFKTDKQIIHMPLLRILQRPMDSKELQRIFGHIPQYTHVVFTSKSAVKFFLFSRSWSQDRGIKR